MTLGRKILAPFGRRRSSSRDVDATVDLDAAVHDDTNAAAARGRVGRWIRRFGAAGFLFFLIKGLLWLLVPGLIALGVFR